MAGNARETDLPAFWPKRAPPPSERFFGEGGGFLVEVTGYLDETGVLRRVVRAWLGQGRGPLAEAGRRLELETRELGVLSCSLRMGGVDLGACGVSQRWENANLVGSGADQRATGTCQGTERARHAIIGVRLG
jgi:hypothetical protein